MPTVLSVSAMTSESASMPRIVRWLDSSLQNGQVDKDDFPKPCVITSVGYVVREHEEHIVLARDDMGHDGDYRGLVAIPQRAVLAVRTNHTSVAPPHHVQPDPDIASDTSLYRTISPPLISWRWLRSLSRNV